jgi:predicted nucleic acid-binding protein
MRTLLSEGRHEIILSAWVLEETQNTLHNDFGVPWSIIQAFTADLQLQPHAIEQPTPITLAPYHVADFDDRIVLTAALVAEVDVLVTGDKALQAVAEVVRQAEGLLIMTPGDFWRARGTLW